jgi:hypothetical protein
MTQQKKKRFFIKDNNKFDCSEKMHAKCIDFTIDCMRIDLIYVKCEVKIQ